MGIARPGLILCVWSLWITSGKVVLGRTNATKTNDTTTAAPAPAAPAEETSKVQRLPVNQPIINVELLPSSIPHGNINGPSMIRVPNFVTNPLGTYYLYFSHHDGKAIHFAYAQSVGGPYTVHPTGSLKLEQVVSKNICLNHIASPDVIVDHEKQEIRMYYHCPAAKMANFKVSSLNATLHYSTFYFPNQIISLSAANDVRSNQQRWYIVHSS